jgi:hypothetical protein
VSFADYILSCRVADSARGDFVKGAQALIRAGKMPRVRTWRELECFILGAGGCPHVVEAARSIWIEFERERASEMLLYRL